MRTATQLRIYLLALLASLPAVARAADENKDRPKFVVYASEENAEFASSLYRILRGKGEPARIDKAATLQQALDSPAEVLVLVLPEQQEYQFEQATLDAIKNRKVVGIGYGAAKLFGQLGLEIHDGACAHGVQGPPRITVGNNQLLGEPKNAESFFVLQDKAEPQLDQPNETKPDVFAVFLPPSSANAAAVDVIARWTSSRDYAPIVRQGNYVLIGIPVSAATWSTPYLELISQVCGRLHQRPLEPFAVARFEITKPGVYEFALGRQGNADLPYDKTFYFQFDEPVQFSAQLEHAGSDSVMLLFMGGDQDHTHWTRQDARQNETLSIVADISREDISKIGDRYWTLSVTNFGRDTSQCKLKVTVEEQKPKVGESREPNR